MLKPILLGLVLICSTLNSFSQSTESLFSTPGLSVNTFHFNFFDGTYSTSFSFVETKEICGKSVARFVNNQTGYSVYLYFENSKVYHIRENSCDMILYFDYDLMPGDIAQGVFNSFEVIEIGNYELLSGEMRRMIKLDNGNVEETWVEGIGSLSGGISPMPFDFEGGDNFVCARVSGTDLIVNDILGGQCDEYSCIRPIPKFDLTSDDFEITIENQSEFTEGYIWDFGDGNISAAVNPSHIYQVGGCYDVTLTATNACFGPAEPVKAVVNVCVAEPWVFGESIDTMPYGFNIQKFSDELQFLYNSTNLYRSTDEGETWDKMNFPNVPGVSRFITDIAMYDDANGIAVCGHYGAQSTQTAILTTTDAGQTWTEKAPGSYFVNEVTTGSNGLAWVSGNLNKYFRSTDYGATWENLTYPAAFNIYEVFDVGNDLLLARSYEGLQPSGQYYIASSTDQGITWQKKFVPANINEFIFLTPDVGYGYDRNTDEGLFKTINGGDTWDLVYANVQITELFFVDDQIGWLSSLDGLVHYTIDGATSFSKGNCGNSRMSSLTAIDAEIAYGVVGNSIYEFDLGATADCQIVDQVEELSNDNFKIYPNPAKSYLRLESTIKMNTEISVTNIYGQTELRLTHINDNSEFDISKLANGVYFLNIQSTKEGKSQSLKFIKIE